MQKEKKKKHRCSFWLNADRSKTSVLASESVNVAASDDLLAVVK